nr:zinc ribbon-containing protein [Thalassotalea sp. G2M2-11]
MPVNKERSSDFYNRLSRWIVDVKQHEVTKIVEIVEHAKVVLKAAETIPEEKVKQFIDNFNYDLHEFYQQYQEQAKHSIYLGLMNESFWALMENITDKSQVEWAELSEDFQHQGEYTTGDYIGFGIIECQKCHHILHISHLTEITDCLHCGHNHFTRKSLTP